MPTETFSRLPEEKRQRITQAAAEEFARVRYSLASINRIVKAANISRGSFYQYFTDKEDLFQYLLSLIRMEKLDVYNRDAHPVSGDLFAPITAALPAIFHWAEAHPLYYRIGYFLASEEPDFVRRMLLHGDEGRRWFTEFLAEARAGGQIRPDADLDLVVDLIIHHSIRLFEQYYRTQDRAQCARALEALFDLLSRGIRQEGGDDG